VLGSLEAQLIPLFEHLYQTFGYAGVVVAMAIESACIPLPSEVILPLAGWMVSRGIFNFWVTVLSGTLGCVIGSTIAYWVGYFGGRPLLERWGRYVLISPRDLDIAEHWFGRYGEVAIFFSRMLPVVRTFISLPAGIAEMSFGRFILYTALGSIPWSIALVYVGKELGDNWEAIRPVIQKFDYLIVAVIVLGVAWYIYHHVAHLINSGEATATRE